VGLLELLDPLGRVSAKLEGTRWRIHYNNVLGEFYVDQSRARVQGRDADLSARFLLENGRGLVPVESLSSLLPRFLGGPATLHEDSGRLFIGSVATHFTASVAAEDASRLIFHFSNPVNPTVSSEAGKLRMSFPRDPITAPASPTLTFASKVIPSATYSEGNGAAAITVSTNTPLMASFSSDGRTITLAPAKQPGVVSAVSRPGAAVTPASAPAASAGSQPHSSAVLSTTNSSPPSSAPSPPSSIAPPSSLFTSRKYFAVVDAGHGGSDRGEALSPTLAEKEVTLAFARQLRQELESRGIPTLVLRDSDVNLALDDRASSANASHAAVYIALHAASSGQGVRLYTGMLPYSDSDDRGPFRAWATAQRSAATLSEAMAASIADTLKKIQIPVRILSAPLGPLNSIVTAAIAIEVAPPGGDVSALNSADYQQLIVGAVANGILDMRTPLAAAP
jgi:N-acetylmuramoyl-L-alanine amidase